MTTEASTADTFSSRYLTLDWKNWPLALAVCVIVMPLSIALLPPAVSFWVSAAACALVALTAVINAWGRYKGGLLVAPAIALLFVMNIFFPHQLAMYVVFVHWKPRIKRIFNSGSSAV